MLLFAKLPHVAFTNNRAERDLRMSKVKQKVSGCFRTRQYAEAYCRISSYLQTMANQGYNPLVAIQLAFSGQFLDQCDENVEHHSVVLNRASMVEFGQFIQIQSEAGVAPALPLQDAAQLFEIVMVDK